jgi:hypothetical protein
MVRDNPRYYSLNGTVRLSAAVAADVLDPSVAFKLNVTAQDGSHVAASDGTLLKDADPTKAYDFPAAAYGRYTVSIVATDTSGNRQEYGYVVNVYDDIAPTFTFDGALPAKAKVGEAVKLPKASATDNADGAVKFTVTLFHHGQSVVLTKDAFIASAPGIYTVRWYAADSNGNIGAASFAIEITA